MVSFNTATFFEFSHLQRFLSRWPSIFPWNSNERLVKQLFLNFFGPIHLPNNDHQELNCHETFAIKCNVLLHFRYIWSQQRNIFMETLVLLKISHRQNVRTDLLSFSVERAELARQCPLNTSWTSLPRLQAKDQRRWRYDKLNALLGQ